jgi:two-component sensor histidine kinase
LFSFYLKLYDEYASFNCDSAYAYAEKLQKVARQSNSTPRVAYARMKLSFILLSSGMFKEAFDSLGNVSLHHLNSSQKGEYYTMMARCYYDLADYNRDSFYTPLYNSKANAYVDSALVLFQASYEYSYYIGLQQIRDRNLDEADRYLKNLLRKQGLTTHQVAVTASTLSDIYIREGQNDTATILLARAAIADIQSATKETSAIFHLATLLFRQGDVKNATVFVQRATRDAHFYGSRQRKVQLSAILPLIESQKINQIEYERNNLLIYAVILQHLLKEKDGLLTEKEWLLKEIHHRVKNNLQVVMSLLNSQAAYLSDDTALSAIKESQHRVHTMALIHQKLYQSEQIACVDMPSYINEVVGYLQESYSHPRQILFKLNVEPIELDVTQAVPLGLIINEAIINAFKYAFPGGASGTVALSLHRLGESTFQLTISDDGIGLPAGYDPARSRSLGMTLMHGFSGQLGASFGSPVHAA